MDHQKVLTLFSQKFTEICDEMLGVKIRIHKSEFTKSTTYQPTLNTVALLDFRGSRIGFLACACKEETIASLLNITQIPSDEDQKNSLRQEYGGALSETMNIISGELVPQLRNEIPIITILSPKIIFNSGLIFPEVECYNLVSHTDKGDFTFTLCLDEMQQDILKLLDKAKEANKTKSEFLATMSHEIRTPINGVIGMAELLLDTNLDEEQNEYGNIIKQSAESLLTIVNDILDFSKIEAGKLTLENIRFDLFLVLESCIDVVAAMAYKKGLELSLLIDSDVPHFIMGDPTRLRQVILNLLSNAIKFSTTGQVTLFVHTESLNEYDLTLKFEIEDEGTGISDENLDKLFQSFSQVDASMTRRFGGTGLGLAISKLLAEKMGGSIGVNSELERGSLFWFTTHHQLCNDRKVRHIFEEPISREIILVDSYDRMEQTLNHYLHPLNIQLTRVSEINSCLEILEHEQLTPEVIICCYEGDIPLYQYFKKIKLIKQKVTDLKLIFLTEYGYKFDIQNVFDAGFDGYLVKPLKLNDIKYCVEKNLKKKDKKDLNNLNAVHGIRKKLPSNLNILMVEDNKINQKVIEKIMKKFNLNYSLAENGEKAVEVCKQQKFDMIFMDLQMPIMDGHKTTSKIRETEQLLNQKTPIIALTANTSEDIKILCFENGMDDFLSKPIRSEELLNMIEKFCPEN